MTKKILITGAAGLVGQNLVARLKNRQDIELIGVDKHGPNGAIFRQLNPGVPLIEADLNAAEAWRHGLEGVDMIVMNHAQIGALDEAPFIANNVDATAVVLAQAKAYGVEELIHISSSVVRSKADDFYTRSKIKQEEMVLASGLKTLVLRPTLLFGWYDRKHLGWLSRFMQRSPFFPIPNFGRYIRQPLYAGDFCAIIEACIDRPKFGGIYDISGQEQVYYGDLIRALKRACKARSLIVPIPYALFWALVKVYGLLVKTPPFTPSQLAALVVPETFPVIDWPEIFGVRATPLHEALEETYAHPLHSSIVLAF